MSNRLLGSPIAVRAMVIVFSLLPVLSPANAQTSAGQTWEPARTPDGQPDIQGFWRYRSDNKDSYEFYTLEGLLEPSKAQAFIVKGVDRREAFESVIIDPPDGRIPYQPWALAKRNELSVAALNPTKPEHVDGRALCFLAGVPRQTYEAMGAGPHQILQTAGYVVMVWEWAHSYRIIPLDGRPHVPPAIKLWQGDSRGRWDGKTLTVDTTNQNGKWLDLIGDFYTDALRVVERYTIVDADTIRYEATLEDPNVYTRPWTIALLLVREKAPGFQLFEEACYEGNRVDLPVGRR